MLESRIIKTEPINWRSLEFIQQDDFKEWLPNGNKKLLESLLNLGDDLESLNIESETI